MAPITAWVSPHDPYKTVAGVVDAARQVERKTGRKVRVALPTAYGMWTQGQGLSRSIGAELSGMDPAHIGRIRANIEAYGTGCDGWCVPLGRDDDPYHEGYFHGQIAAEFDNFFINFEAGWPDFWTKPQDVWASQRYINGFWQALTDLNRADALHGHVGLTWVPNSMLTAVPDYVKMVWLEGTHFDALEVYIPGDRNLDPYKGSNIWQGVLDRLGMGDRPYVVMVEHGDLLTYLRDLDEPNLGTHLWTLHSTSAYFANLPEVAPEPEPEPEEPVRETPEDYPHDTWRESAIAYRGALDSIVPELHELRELEAAVAGLASTLRDVADKLEEPL